MMRCSLARFGVAIQVAFPALLSAMLWPASAGAQTTYLPTVTAASYSRAVPPVPAPLPIESTLQSKSILSAEDRIERLNDIFEEAKDELTEEQLPDVQIAERQLREALSNLESFIGPDTSNGRAWDAFLRLDELREQLSSERPSLSVLNELDMNMRQNYLGLEYPQFIALREALSQYTDASRFGARPDRTIEFLKQKIDQTLSQLSSIDESSESSRRLAIEEMLTYLNRTNQANASMARIQALYSDPNLSITIKESKINELLARTVAEPQQVNECLLGTRIIGDACLSGSVTADVMPASDGVALQLNLSAQVNTTSRGYNRGVVLNTTSFSPVFASKQLFASLNGISSSPATVTASLSSRINSIEHRLKLVRKIAKKKAAQQKPKADAIARGRLQRRVQRNYDKQVEEQLTQANVQLASFQQRMPELSRLGLEKPAVAINSTNDTVDADAVQAATSQLSAESSCSFPQPATAAVIFRAHQSALVNTLDTVLGGRTIRSQDLPKYAKQITGKVPEDMLKEQDEPEWSVTMKAFRPVQVDFDDQLITITLKLADMKKGQQSLGDEATIKASYLPSFSDGVLTLDRQQDLVLSFKKADRGVKAVTFKAFFQGKFEEVFKQQIVTQKVDLANRFPRLPAIALESYQIDDGWLQISLR